jgi:hypothetical protein
MTARDVSLSILAASQTDWLMEKLKESDIRGGFMARFMFWPAFTKRRFIPIPLEPDAHLGNLLVQRLNTIRRLEGPVTLPSSVRERYAAWLQVHEQQLDTLARAGQLGPFWSRLAVITLKLATIVTVASAPTLLVTDEALESAIGLTEFMKAALAHLFDQEIAFTPDMRNRQRVLQAVRRHPGISLRDLYRTSSLLKRQADAVLETLRAECLIEVRDKGYWPVGESEPVSEAATDTRIARFVRKV